MWKDKACPYHTDALGKKSNCFVYNFTTAHTVDMPIFLQSGLVIKSIFWVIPQWWCNCKKHLFYSLADIKGTG